MAKDDGWLASFFDALARIHGPVQDYLTEPGAHEALLRGGPRQGDEPGSGAPGIPVQRGHDAADHAPADRCRTGSRTSRAIWRSGRTCSSSIRKGKYDAKLSARRRNWKEPDDVLEALFALCRKPVDNEPLKIFMALSDLDRNRAQAAATRRRWNGWSATITLYGAQYAIFNDAPTHQRQDDRRSGWIRREAVDQHPRSAVARRTRRDDAGADRNLADLLPPGKHSAGEGGRDAGRSLLTPFADSQERPRAVRCGPRRA